MNCSVPSLKLLFSPKPKTLLIIRIGLWGPLYYNYNKEPPNPTTLELSEGQALIPEDVHHGEDGLELGIPSLALASAGSGTNTEICHWCNILLYDYPPTPLGRRPEVRLASASVP